MIRLVRQENSQTLYYSKKMGADYGAPQGGWTPEARLATTFESVTLAQQFIDTQLPPDYRLTCRIEEP